MLMEPLRRWDPEQIGGYALIGRLGAGAMGQVFLGRSTAGRLVAVKTIRIELAEEPDFRDRFAHEVAAARRVSGAFTAPVVAADPEADVPWLATSYVPAPALSTLVGACGPLPVSAVRWLAAGCAEALESIHGAGLIHRDLKPSNVLVSTDGPRVIDFGLARSVERVQLTLTRSAVGTPAYMAPEQARDTLRTTTASDVYSLGAIMVFAATGHAPYLGDTVMDVLVRLATEEPDLSDLPDDLADVVQACLHRDQAGRPTARAVLASLAPDVPASADSRELGPDYLSGAALALLADYRDDPGTRSRTSTQPATDDTFDSLPAGALRAIRGEPAGPAKPARSARRGPVLAAASLVAAMVLLAAGLAIGMNLAASKPSASGGNQRTGNQPSGNHQLSGLGPPPTSPGAVVLHGKRVVAMNLPFGDGGTGFVVYGSGWTPGLRLTISLVGVGSSRGHTVADLGGNFSFAINQDHEFFRGRIPIGIYQVVVTSAGGGKATTTFTVGRP